MYRIQIRHEDVPDRKVPVDHVLRGQLAHGAADLLTYGQLDSHPEGFAPGEEQLVEGPSTDMLHDHVSAIKGRDTTRVSLHAGKHISIQCMN